MNKNLLFFVVACSLFVLSIITINIAPIINYGGKDTFFEDWGIENCQLLDDRYKKDKADGFYSLAEQKPKEDQTKRIIDECKKHKVMHGLEYASLITDVCLGFICTLLGLIHFIEPGKPLEKYSGIIGLLAGVITLVLTIIYAVFSIMIFNNEPIRDQSYTILYPNKASLHLSGNKYVYNYDIEKQKDDLDVPYIKYKDLGKKEYNYDSELFKESKVDDSEFSKCHISDFSLFSVDTKKTYGDSYGNTHDCEYIWNTNYYTNISTYNKFIYDRWLTTIIFSIIIAVCGIGLAIFGFLLSKSEGDSGATPLQQQ